METSYEIGNISPKMASAVPELTCGEYQSDMDSSKHGKGPEDDQEVQNPHHRGNGIYMDDCWGIIAKPAKP